MPNRPFLPGLALAAVLLFGAGCAANDPDARAEKRPGFGNVPARDRQLALAGEVRPGMTADAVFVAWGPPTHVYQGRAGSRVGGGGSGGGGSYRNLESWVYLRPMPARPSPDFGNFPADYAAAQFDFLSAYYRGDRFANSPGAVNSRYYPGAVFYPGPIGGDPTFGVGGFGRPEERPILDKQAIFENGRLVRFVKLRNPAGADGR